MSTRKRCWTCNILHMPMSLLFLFRWLVAVCVDKSPVCDLLTSVFTESTTCIYAVWLNHVCIVFLIGVQLFRVTDFLLHLKVEGESVACYSSLLRAWSNKDSDKISIYKKKKFKVVERSLLSLVQFIYETCHYYL